MSRINSESLPTLTTRPVHRVITLSVAQERLWFLEQLQGGQSANHLALNIRLRGRVHMPDVTWSLGEILRRHDVLRMAVRNVRGRAVAGVNLNPSLDLPLDDLTLLPYAERETRAREIVAAEARRPFDLSRQPLLRARLLRLAPEDHLLVVTAHCLAVDPQSLGIIYDEWTRFYQASAEGKLAESPELPMTWFDYAEWQSRQLNGNAFEEHMAYWTQKLVGKPQVLDFPLDHARPPIQAGRSARKAFAVRSDVHGQLKALGERLGTTLDNVLLAAFLVLLHRWTRQEEILVGCPVFGRTHPGSARMVGPLSNVLPLRADLAGEPGFTTLLERVYAVKREGEIHADLPFAALLDAIPVERDLSRPPLFQALFAMEHASFPAVDLPGLSISTTPVDIGFGRMDLALTAQEQADGITGTMEYNPDLLNASTILRMIGHYNTLLQSIANDPKQSIARLPILPGSEERQILQEWNQTETAYPRNKCVHQLFEEQVQRTPDAVALVFEDQQLTYRELNAKADRLARDLRRLGVGPDIRVCICMLRSLDMVVGLYAIHKAGGAYVPMDPGYPAERVAFMLEDAQVPVLLTQEALRDLLPATSAKVVCVDTLAWNESPSENTLLQGNGSGAHSRSEASASATPENLAYVIYTSGSTGKPKGVMVRHRNAVNFFTGMDLAIGRGPGVWLAVTSISFDISVLELFWTLTRGFKVVVQGDDAAAARVAAMRGRKSAGPTASYAIADQIQRHGVTHLQCTPSLAGMMLQDPKTREALRQVKQFMFGGEPMPPALVGQLQGFGEVYNMYGPTETTVWSTVHPITSQGGTISIGRPIANTEIYLLDKYFQPVPTGVPGELFIGGAGVVRGYLNRPELTGERFIPHPFRNNPEARLYRTGDLARYQADGSIEFLGRMDFQVKLRGFRIELGEIEAALRQHPDIRDGVVSLWEAGANDKRLVAYYVAQVGANIPSLELRRFLKGKLPEYMVPAAFISLEKLPLTPNGKVDRKALPAPDAQRMGSSSEHTPPGTPWEKMVVAVWEEVLRKESIGLQDDFFALGGQSLQAAVVHAQVCDQLQVEFPLAKLFQFRTAGSLAKFLQEEHPGSLLPDNPEARAQRQRRALGFSPHAQEPLSQPPSHPPMDGIAIIGVAGRFPGVRGIHDLWKHLTRPGGDHASATSAGTLEAADAFDADFFRITKEEAEAMDPQHRVFLECAWQALEDAGHAADPEPRLIGVFASASPSTYLFSQLMQPGHGQAGREMITANDKDTLPRRVSQKLDLRGPSMSVQSGRASSLVSVCMACQQLVTCQCDMALAGGVSILFPPTGEDNRSQPNGNYHESLLSEAGSAGAGVLVLKRLTDALADGDQVYAVIKGFAVNHDGADSLDRPETMADRHVECFSLAQAMAGAEAESIKYVALQTAGRETEAVLGLAPLSRALRQQTRASSFCAIGSAQKTHDQLNTIPGMAHLLRVALALHHKQMPPTILSGWNTGTVELATSPFYINQSVTEWQAGGKPRRAAVSCFAGANATLILEEAPPGIPLAPSRSAQLLLLSAKTPGALEAATADLSAYLKSGLSAPLADVAYTLQTGRRAFDHRRVVVFQDAQAAAEALQTLDPERVFSRTLNSPVPGVVFLFPGAESVQVNMGLELYRQEAHFREQMDVCAEMLKAYLDTDLRELLYPAPDRAAVARTELAQPELAQPALFAFEYALAKLWMHWGFAPKAMMGFGPGEYVAACLAGVFSLKEALILTTIRASLNKESSQQTMMELFLDLLRETQPKPPRIPYLSSTTGQWVTPEQAADPKHWVEQSSSPAGEGISQLLQAAGRIYLEVGPGQALSSLVQQHRSSDRESIVVASLAGRTAGMTEMTALLNALGQLWLNGLDVNWKNFYAREQRRRSSLPAYPFERKRFWLGSSLNIGPTPESDMVGTVITTPPSEPQLRQVESVRPPQDRLLEEETQAAVSTSVSPHTAPADERAQEASPARSANPPPAMEPPVTHTLAETKGEVIKTLPITEAQREIWYGAQVSDEVNCSFNQSAMLCVRGPLDLDLMTETIRWLVNRHEGLRVTFSSNGEGQNLHASMPCEVPVMDLIHLPSAARQDELSRLMQQEVNKSFDLAKGPLFRAKLVKLTSDEHTLIMTLHHIVCDGGSLGVLLQELSEYYSARVKGEAGPPDLVMNYSEFVVEQEAALQSPDRARAEAYWLEQYSRPAPVLDLPTDRPREKSGKFIGGSGGVFLDRSLVPALKSLSARNRCTITTTLLAVYYLLMHRLSGQQDIVIGLPMTSRSGEGGERLVGHCVNFLPLRLHFEGDPTFLEYLSRVWAMLIDAHENQNYTLGSLLKKLHLPRDPTRMPLTSVMFNLDWVQEPVILHGLKTEIKPNPFCFARFDLSFSLAEDQGNLELYSHYRAELFDPETIQRWFKHYETLLKSILANPQQRISKLALLTPPEQHQLLVDWATPQPEILQLLPTEVLSSASGARSLTGDLAAEGYRFYVLDPCQQPCSIGVRGDLYVSVPDNPPIMARAHAAPANGTRDPFRTEAGFRIYPTGLAARFLRHGRLELITSVQPAPIPDTVETLDNFEESLNPIEEKLVQIWSEVISLDEVRLDDNFFDLGGHSVLLIQVITRVRKTFGAELTLRHLFEAPTVRELARVIERQLEKTMVKG